MTEASQQPTDAVRHSWDVQEAASALGFDWPDASGVLDKVVEESQEIREALGKGNPDQARRELGDLLLATINLARFLKADPANELRRATERFTRRFDEVKKEAADLGLDMKSCSLDQLNALWNRAKVRTDQGLEEGP